MNVQIGFNKLFVYSCFLFFASSLKIKFKKTRHVSCPNDTGEELNLYKLSLEKCVKKCALRSSCAGLMYRKYGEKCSLYLHDDCFKIVSSSSSNSAHQCVLVEKDDINVIEGATEECNQNEEYDANEESCKVRECPKPNIMHGRVYGNIRNIGSRIAYTCDFVFPTKTKMQSVCAANGTWTPDPHCDVSCLHYLLPSIPDDHLSASSSHSIAHSPNRSRLDITELYDSSTRGYLLTGAWSNNKEDINSYIQVRWDEEMRVHGIVTKGRNGGTHIQYVKTYNVAYSFNCSSFVFVKADNENKRVFVGNTDTDTESVQFLPDPIQTRCIRLYPMDYHEHVSMRFDIIGCRVGCTAFLVSGIYGVPDINLNASSWDNQHITAGPQRARLNTPDTQYMFGGWFVDQGINDIHNNHYIQVKFRTVRTVTSVVTQGVNTTLYNNLNNCYTSAYTVAYSDDCLNYYNVSDPQTGTVKVFNANSHWYSTIENVLPERIDARCVRIVPETYNERKGLRFDLKGCINHTCPESPDRIMRPDLTTTFTIQITPDPYITSTAAKQLCEGKNGSLADMDRPDVRQYVTTLLVSCSVYAETNQYWISQGFLEVNENGTVSVQTCMGDVTVTAEDTDNLTCSESYGYICQWI